MVNALRDMIIDKTDLNSSLSELIAALTVVLLVIATFILSYLFIKKIILKILYRQIAKTKTKWDDYLIKRRVLDQLAYIVPVIIVHQSTVLFPYDLNLVRKITLVLITFIVGATICRLIETVNDIYLNYESSKTRPIKGYLQIVQIFVMCAATIIAVSIFIERSPWALLAGLGAATAVLLLIFQNTILGLVASIQLSTNDMVKIGDWIEVPSYGIDGDVIEVSLHTVKVQNWDKPIVTIPPQALINGSFKNWRGMYEAGGRRIKRCVYIDMTSIKFCDEEMLRRFSQIQYISDYIKERSEEIQRYNENLKINTASIVNGRHMTNIGTFRAYIESYLKNHPKINHNLISMVRQLQPDEKGLPLEIYAFTNTTAWIEYENIQSDIFDHILSIVREFDLEIFQNPAGSDIRGLRDI